MPVIVVNFIWEKEQILVIVGKFYIWDKDMLMVILDIFSYFKP